MKEAETINDVLKELQIKQIRDGIYTKIHKEYGKIANLSRDLFEFLVLRECLSRYDDAYLHQIAKNCEYREYLRSPYWKIIRNFKLYTDRQCRICKTNSRLTVHHKTYEHLGIEFRYLEDLDVLCWKCHIEERRKQPLPSNDKIIQEVVHNLSERFNNE